MISYEDALAAVLDAAKPLPAETVALDAADGRVLAADVKARFDFPRYDQSAMDGYAVLHADTVGATERSPRALAVTGEMAAGCRQTLRLKSGCAVRIFTGSRLPAGCDAVIKQELCRRDGDTVLVQRPAALGDHIRRRGEELRRGGLLLTAGTVVTPPVTGLLAFNGNATARVHRVPDVTLITLGDELLGPDEPLTPGKIRDSNGPALAAALRGMSVGRIRTARVGDDPGVLKRVLKQAIARSDVVITAGGASVGDHDHVKDVRRGLGVRERFEVVRVKPGKPVVFGTAADGTLLFGLPGNPVSALVSFHQFVRPALARLAGRMTSDSPRFTAELTEPIRNKPGRLTWVRGRLEIRDGRWFVRPTKGQGSHMLTGMATADVLIEVGEKSATIPMGDMVHVTMLEWCMHG